MSKITANDVSIRVVTPSFRGDFERCEVLCASFDAFAGPEFHHQVIVPRRDLSLFRDLRGARREILCVEDVLPARVLHLPGRRKEWWLLGLRHRRRGWLVQQLVKVAAAKEGGVDAVVFADSDIVLVRPLTASHFVTDGRVRLYRSPGTEHYALDPNFAKWYRGAARLFGVAVEEPYPAHFVGPLKSWAPDVVQAMCERIEHVAGRPWIDAVARLANGLGFSEYTAYGVYVDLVDERARDRHFTADGSYCHLSWNYDLSTPGGRDAFVAGLDPQVVAVLIQSNLRLPPPEWRALLDALAVDARIADAGAATAGQTP